MSDEPTREALADEGSTPAPDPSASSPARPTFQTAASEAADVASQAVAQQVAAATAARMAAAEADAAREAEAVRAAEAIEAARAADVAASTEAASVDSGAQPGTEGVPTPVAGAALAGAPATAAAPADASPSMSAAIADAGAIPAATETAALPAAPDAATPAAPAKPSRRPVLLAWSRRLVFFVLSLALLVGGVALGNATFLRMRQAPVGGGAIEFTQRPAPVAQEFITALGAGDADAVRSSLMPQPNKDLTDEFTKFGIKKVTSVETLGTSLDGDRSATEVLMHTLNTEGNTFDINLIILVQGNQIEGFR